MILIPSPEIHEDVWEFLRYGIASVALCDDWIKEYLPADHCNFQSYIWWNENFRIIKDKVELKVGVGDMNLEVDQVSQHEMNCTGIPTHNTLKPNRGCIATASISVTKQLDSWCDFNSSKLKQFTIKRGTWLHSRATWYWWWFDWTTTRITY